MRLRENAPRVDSSASRLPTRGQGRHKDTDSSTRFDAWLEAHRVREIDVDNILNEMFGKMRHHPNAKKPNEQGQ
jgi:hypothetical protein